MKNLIITFLFLCSCVTPKNDIKTYIKERNMTRYQSNPKGGYKVPSNSHYRYKVSNPNYISIHK
jgi:hypothetical protein